MRTKTSVSQEDYLKAIWELLEEGQPPISARLAEELSVTPPAVTAQLLQQLPVADLTVEDPPIEEVIDRVFQDGLGNE